MENSLNDFEITKMKQRLCMHACMGCIIRERKIHCR